MKILIIMIISTLLVSCSTNDEIKFNEVIEEINHLNENMKIPEVNVNQFTNILDENELISLEKFIELFEQKIFKNEISKEEIKSDIELYFKILKTSYAPYNYYGGDKVFLEIKDEVINYIETKDIINTTDLILFINEKFSFIDDKHFFFQNPSKIKSEYVFSNNEIEFLKDDNGFYKIEDDEKIYLEEIDNSKELEKYLKLALAENGKLSYNLYKVIENENNYSDILFNKEDVIEIIFEDRGQAIDIPIKAIGVDSYKGNEVFKYEEINEIPVISMKAMTFSNEPCSEEFLQTARATREEKITILDIRDNSGGNGFLPVQWIEERFKEIPKNSSKGIYLNRFSNMDDEYFHTSEHLCKYFSLDIIDDYFGEFKSRENDELIENENYIFVIVDKNSGSAAEYFIELLKGIENVIVVGSNSYGLLNSSSMGLLYLPNSGINFTYGNWLKIFDEEVFKEGVGFMPDILIDDENAIEAVLNLIEYYELDKD